MTEIEIPSSSNRELIEELNHTAFRPKAYIPKAAYAAFLKRHKEDDWVEVTRDGQWVIRLRAFKLPAPPVLAETSNKVVGGMRLRKQP